MSSSFFLARLIGLTYEFYFCGQENSNKVNYIQIPVDSYTYLTSLEDQVDTLEGQISMLQDRVNDLTDDLYAADLEITAKDTSVKQHEKVAGEAVSGTNIFYCFCFKGREPLGFCCWYNQRVRFFYALMREKK